MTWNQTHHTTPGTIQCVPAVIARHARRTILRYKADHPWTDRLLAGLRHLQALPAP
ncbi:MULTISPECIES: hypothetical protein [Actinomyces]|uniref:Uncharacterized protein n=1 Tax=Actinomyces respiraculi TaxID=2744574 RepID=A0A7T0LNY5_9ACTO|nr:MULTISPECIES: hypothetical protein [Actinomyces]QPL06738.1 hypothetical protein ID810_04470 [Actinomyces respiraculi]